MGYSGHPSTSLVDKMDGHMAIRLCIAYGSTGSTILAPCHFIVVPVVNAPVRTPIPQ